MSKTGKSRIDLDAELKKVKQLMDEFKKAKKERAAVEASLRDKEEMLSSIIRSTSDAVICTDAADRVTLWNAAAEKMFGFTAAEMLGKTLDPIVPEGFREAHAKGVKRVVDSGETHIIGTTVEMTALRKSGDEFPVELTLSMWKTNGAPCFSGIIRDITERKAAEEKLNQLAFFDILTGLPNRMLFFDRLNQAMKQAKRENHLLSLFFIDLDTFKEVNDTRGHDMGDRVLVETARRLTDSVRQTDTVARMGGDEFTILLPHVAKVQDVELIVKKIIANITAPYFSGADTLSVAASIGISLFPYDGRDADTLVKNADTAMYMAKRAAGASYRFFSQGE